jgi:hypothetical protein
MVIKKTEHKGVVRIMMNVLLKKHFEPSQYLLTDC